MNEDLYVFVDPLGVQGRKVHVSGPDDCEQVLFSFPLAFFLWLLVEWLVWSFPKLSLH